MPISEDMAAVREDVAYIRGRIESWDERLDNHDARITKLERRFWGMPASAVAALLAALGIHFS